MSGLEFLNEPGASRVAGKAVLKAKPQSIPWLMLGVVVAVAVLVGSFVSNLLTIELVKAQMREASRQVMEAH